MLCSSISVCMWSLLLSTHALPLPPQHLLSRLSHFPPLFFPSTLPTASLLTSAPLFVRFHYGDYLSMHVSLLLSLSSLYRFLFNTSLPRSHPHASPVNVVISSVSVWPLVYASGVLSAVTILPVEYIFSLSLALFSPYQSLLTPSPSRFHGRASQCLDTCFP